MEARAAVAVERGADGRDRVVGLRSAPPLTLRATPGGVHLVGSSAGPLGGDDLHLAVAVGPEAALTVRSAAAVLVQPGAAGGASRLRIDVTVAAGGTLVWDPEPTVVVQGCDHETTAVIRLGPGASLVWRDEVVLGRHGEPPGSLRQRLVVDVVHDGPEQAPASATALLRNELVAGPRWPGSLGPAGTGAATRVVGTLLLAGPPAVALGRGPLDAPPGVRAAALDLAGPGVVVTAVAAEAVRLRPFLDRCRDQARQGWVRAAPG